MSTQWKKVTVGEIAEVKGGKRLPKGKLVQDEPTPFPYLRVTDFGDNGLDTSAIKYIDEDAQSKVSRYTITNRDIYISIAGTIGRVGIVPAKFSGANLTENAAKICEIHPHVDERFLMYFLRTENGQGQIAGLTVGTSQPKLALFRIKEIEISLPDLPTQRKIAGILSAYDDLIENNLRRIKILEAMAQSLYREWFVHFRFPGHESACFIDSSLGRIPKGWEVRKILDFADVIYGFSFKANRFNTAGEGVPVVRIRNIQDGKSETYSEEEGDPKHRVKNGDILVGMDGDFHMTIWSGGDAWQNQRVAKFRPKGAMGNYLLFLALEKPIHYFDSTITGTTVAHLGDSHIKTIEFPSPPEALMRKASDLLEPMAQEQLNLRRRNQTLRRTRDLLLPKLLAADQNLDEARP